jgi:acyl-CoA thioester hydrolase
MTHNAEDETTGRVHHTSVQMRFADTDAMGHVNNGSFVVYAETGRIDFMKALGAVDRSFILAHLAVDFRRQVRFRESIDVESWVEKIGTSSMTLRQAIRADGTVAADVRAVVVSFDYAANRSRPWTAELRRAMEGYLHCA